MSVGSAVWPPSLFVTGTDTGVGKTLVSCALLRRAALAGRSAVGMKPVAAGEEVYPDIKESADVRALRQASTVEVPRHWQGPYSFEPPIAPHLAASEVGTSIELPVLLEAYAGLASRADTVIVEGAGGALVPLNEHEDMLDLARALELPVLLVVGIRLGCLNHALLTAEAIAARGLRCVGWVANCVAPDTLRIAENIGSLRGRMAAPFLATLPWGTDVEAAAAALNSPVLPT